MYKNQLQELAQRSCFNLPSYTCIREGPDHAPRFKAAVNFNGDTFESPSYCSTLRQAEHSAAEVALNALSSRGPSSSLAARILDETGVYKNLLQEVSQRVGASLPAYTTFRTGLGHLPVFTCTVQLAGVIFTGEPAKNKKQAEKNAAMAAWLSLKTLVQQFESSTSQKLHKDEQEHVTVARALQNYFQNIIKTTQSQPIITIGNESQSSFVDNLKIRSQKFPAAGAPPYIPVRHCNPHHRTAPPVTIRNSIPVFSAPPIPSTQSTLLTRPPAFGTAPPVCVRQAVPVHAAVKVEKARFSGPPSSRAEEVQVSRAAPGRLDESPFSKPPLIGVEESLSSMSPPITIAPNAEAPSVQLEIPSSTEVGPTVEVKLPVSKAIISPPGSSKPSAEEELAGIEDLKELKI
ncbi:hypothetical protein DH2020_028290 [Rehmannia glutinosa]|uniref:DRBM domain-containing protein n=1 Tax=Rehmannia glutinosa TaxID=99300 RepID=A0ABR0VSS0_REHGL